MISLINNTKSVSVVGRLVSLDQNNTGAFVYTTQNATKAIGVITESVPFRSTCKIATIGDKAKVFVSGNLAKGDIIRNGKSGDNISLGTCIRVKTGDTAYLTIGEALDSGSGLINVILNMSLAGNETIISSSGGDVLLADVYNKDAIGGILLCSQYNP
jgi:hypothetical protein